jgi:glycosyltransferase involved in cell wall biosynthesis
VGQRLRLLVVTPHLPGRQARHGGGTYVAELLLAMAEEADVSLLSLARPAELGREAELAPPLSRARAVRHLWNADMGPARLLVNRGRLFWRMAWAGLPLAAAKFTSRALAHAIGAEISAFTPHAVCLEHSVCAQYLPLLRTVPSVLTDHEAGGVGALWERYVRTFYPDASLLQAVTDADAATLREALGGTRVEVRPVVAAIPDEPSDPSRAQPWIGFIGNYSHAPNRETAAFVARALLPLLRDVLPEVQLLLAGEQMSFDVTALGALPGVRSLGPVASPADLFSRVRCLVAPVFSGAGTRVKVLAALAHGVPVVTNALGARGLDSAPPDAVVQGESEEQLRDAALVFLRDPPAASRAGALGREWCRSNLDTRAVARAQLERIREIVAARPA